jgi:hydroxymethylglutaryl-CoA lyase
MLRPAKVVIDEANAGRDTEAALAEMAAVGAKYPEIRFAAAVSTAFVCPFDGEIPHLTLADTLGIARPDHVTRSLTAVREALPDTELALHLENRGVATGINLDRVHRAADLIRNVLAAAAPLQPQDV